MIEIVPNWHPIWVHFPIALLSLATVFFLLGPVLPDRAGERVTAAARWNLAVGAVLLIPTLITGATWPTTRSPMTARATRPWSAT
ncbi:MAG: DUF2231 domain-containing protein [Pseudomonadota bacterium]